MDNKTKKTKAMILAELLFALFLCGIVMGLAIHMFKSNDVTKTPQLYSVLTNFPKINKTIIEGCFAEGNCATSTSLPDNPQNYCLRFVDSIVTSSNISCNATSNAVTIGGKTYRRNFTLANGLRVYNMGDNTAWVNNHYIDIFVFVGSKPESQGVLGVDLFPIRIFKNGAVIPGVYSDANSAPMQAYDDMEFFAYKIILNRSDSNIDNGRYSRDIFPVSILIDANGNEVTNVTSENNGKVKTKNVFSFREALCRIDSTLDENDDTRRSAMMQNYYGDGVNCSSSYAVVQACDPTVENGPLDVDKSAFCYVEPVRPRGSGVLKIFGI